MYILPFTLFIQFSHLKVPIIFFKSSKLSVQNIYFGKKSTSCVAAYIGHKKSRYLSNYIFVYSVYVHCKIPLSLSFSQYMYNFHVPVHPAWHWLCQRCFEFLCTADSTLWNWLKGQPAYVSPPAFYISLLKHISTSVYRTYILLKSLPIFAPIPNFNPA